jgi:hypothetical protein
MTLVIADCSPEQKLAFLEGLLCEEGRLTEKKLTTLLPMRTTNETTHPSLSISQSTSFFLSIKELISGLLAFDFAFERVMGFRNHIYLLGDETAHAIAQQVSEIDSVFSQRETPVLLDVLAQAGMIYRFNTAHKFGYPPRGSNQLRLNGWGRKYAVDWNVEAAQASSLSVECLETIIAANEADYRELVRLCGSPDRPLERSKILEINKKLPFQIVT